MCKTSIYSVLQSGTKYRKKCHDEFTHARSRRGNAWRCAKTAGSMRKQVVPLRAYCGHSVRALCELCVKMRVQRANRAQTRLQATFTPRCVPQKWQALPQSIACHCGNKIRASVKCSYTLMMMLKCIILGLMQKHGCCSLVVEQAGFLAWYAVHLWFSRPDPLDLGLVLLIL